MKTLSRRAPSPETTHPSLKQRSGHEGFGELGCPRGGSWGSVAMGMDSLAALLSSRSLSCRPTR